MGVTLGPPVWGWGGVGWGPQLLAVGVWHRAGHGVALGGQPRGRRGKGRTVGQDLKEDRPGTRRVPGQTGVGGEGGATDGWPG